MDSTLLEILGTWGIILLGAALIIIAYLGSILPALPGVPFAAVAVIILHFALPENERYGWLSLSIVIGLTVFISVIDLIIPVLGTKKYGGSKAGIKGSTVGLIVGLFISFFTSGFGILALFLGPFIGAYIGERYIAQAPHKVALASAWGSFVGFLAGTVGKVMVVSIILVIYIMGVVRLF